MDINSNAISKSLGPKASKFILGLYEKGITIFSFQEATQFAGLEGKALQKFIDSLVKKGILYRLIRGLYIIVPFEMGYTKEFMGNPYVLVREIVRHKNQGKKGPYYVSHASALALHQMTTQPQLVIYAMVIKQIKQKINIMGAEFHFVTCREADLFGFQKFWVDKSEMILVSDVEKTIVDGLKLPEYCGGITEVAKGLWIKRHEMDYNKLVDYAERIDKGVVYRRLGFLLEVFELDCPSAIDRLQRKLTATYHLLDPILLHEGKHDARWRLKLNILKEEFLSVVRT